jgi:hypothetical protein
MTDLHPAVLVVEDDVDVRMILQRFLRHLLSAMDAQFLTHQSQELGLEGVLTKPFTIEKVRTLLDAVLP